MRTAYGAGLLECMADGTLLAVDPCVMMGGSKCAELCMM